MPGNRNEVEMKGGSAEQRGVLVRTGLIEYWGWRMNAVKLAVCGLLIGLACWTGYAQAQDVVGVIKHTAEPPTLDGLGNDPVWASANTYDDFYTAVAPDPDDDADLSASWKALWDDTNLYVLVEARDEAYLDDMFDWQSDSIEFYINAQHLGYIEEDEPVTTYGGNFGPGDYPIYQLTVRAGETEVYNGINYLRWPSLDPDRLTTMSVVK